jgi:hypothetical protein
MRIKAACHVHSSWSYDGKWSLDELAAAFVRKGYRLLMMSEHDRGFTEAKWAKYREACAEASSDKIFFLPGMEYSDENNVVHVLVWGSDSFLGEGMRTDVVLDSVRSADGVSVLAHPSRHDAWKHFNPGWASKILGIETWNRKFDGWAPSEDTSKLIRAMNVIEFVGMDFHDQRQLFPMSMELEVKRGITEKSILECLRARQCHARLCGKQLKEENLSRILPVMRAAERMRKAISLLSRRRRKAQTSAKTEN